MEQKSFKEIIENIDRCEITDLHEELVICRTSKSRIPEIEKLYKNALGNGVYYNIGYSNPAYEFIADAITYYDLPENMKNIPNLALKKAFKFYTSNTLHFLAAKVIKIGNKFYPIIKQTIDPINAYEFYNMQNWQHYYMLGKHVEEIKKYLKNTRQ